MAETLVWNGLAGGFVVAAAALLVRAARRPERGGGTRKVLAIASLVWAVAAFLVGQDLRLWSYLAMGLAAALMLVAAFVGPRDSA